MVSPPWVSPQVRLSICRTEPCGIVGSTEVHLPHHEPRAVNVKLVSLCSHAMPILRSYHAVLHTHL